MTIDKEKCLLTHDFHRYRIMLRPHRSQVSTSFRQKGNHSLCCIIEYHFRRTNDVLATRRVMAREVIGFSDDSDVFELGVLDGDVEIDMSMAY
jgi:hypothetical protein